MTALIILLAGILASALYSLGYYNGKYAMSNKHRVMAISVARSKQSQFVRSAVRSAGERR